MLPAGRRTLPARLVPEKCRRPHACRWKLSVVFGLFFLLCLGSMTALAGSLSAYTRYDGISLSPDGQAFTTDAGVTEYERYPDGYTVYTGETAAAAPTVGEHYYTVTNVSEVRVLKWEVAWPDSLCIHEIFEIGDYHGIPYSNTICKQPYAQGWFAYCADCGELVANMYMYMNSSTARGIRTIPGNATYYYLCPWCGGLEQGAEYSHTCRRVSANAYTVEYAANAPAGISVTGTMAATGHLYGNASLYEGVSADAAGYGSTCLRLNAYVCDGYRFTGWNTKADGSGIAYADGAAVLNLTSVNGGSVILYAQWEKETEGGQGGDGGTDQDNPDAGDGTDPEAPGPGDGSDPDNPDQDDETETVPLTLTAWVEHSRDGYSGDFKTGEGGVLYLCAERYAERIEVIFPEEFTAVFEEMNRTFMYAEPSLTQEETIVFSVPLYVEPGVYQITVKAYRGEKEARTQVALAVMEESVLDELHTRIRNYR